MFNSTRIGWRRPSDSFVAAEPHKTIFHRESKKSAHVRTMMKQRNKKLHTQMCLPAWAFPLAYIVKITAN